MSICAIAASVFSLLYSVLNNILGSTLSRLEAKQFLEHLPAGSVYALTQWALAAKQFGDGYGCPFDRPQMSFAERLLKLQRLPSPEPRSSTG